MLSFVLTLGLSVAAPPAADDVAWATWEQEAAPQWAARAEQASKKLVARQRFFAGETSLDVAFPALEHASLYNLAAVRGRLDVLQRKASDREAERQEPIDFGDPKRTRAAIDARLLALDAEDAAGAEQRRLLTRIEAHLLRYPDLSDTGLREVTAPLQALLDVPLPEDAEARRAAESAAAEADWELAAWRRLQRQALIHAVRGTPVDVSADVERLEQNGGAHGAAERVRLALPMLQPEVRGPAREALTRYDQGPALQAAQAALDTAKAQQIEHSDRESGEARVAERAAEVEALQAEIDALAEGDTRLAWMPVRLEAAKVRLEATRAAFERVQAQEDNAVEVSEAAARARREAEAAQAAAVDDEQRAQAELLALAADAGERLVALKEQLRQMEADAAQLEKEHGSELADYQALVEQANKASALVGVSDLDVKYGKLRARLMALEGSDIALGKGVTAAEAKAAEVREAVLADQERLQDAPADKTTEQWARSLDRELATADELVALANKVYTEHLAHVRALATQRRALRGYVNTAQHNNDQGTSIREAGLELSILARSMGTLAYNRVGQIFSAPYRLISNGKLMMDTLTGLLWLGILLVAWRWARTKSEMMATRLGLTLRRFRPQVRPMDLMRLKQPLSVALTAGIDLGLGYLMMGRVSQLSGEIGFIVQCWLLLALFRFLLALFDLVVVRAPEFRPSLVALAPANFDRVRHSARLVFIWMIARGFVYYLLWTVLGMDVVTTILETLFNIVGLVLIVLIAHAWYPMLVERVRARNQESRAVAFLSREAPWPLRAPASLALIVFFTIAIVVDLWHFLIAHDRTGLARVFNVVSRYQIAQNEQLEPPSEALVEQLCSRELGEKVYVQREDGSKGLIDAFTDWEKDSRRGLVALVGDRGMGKRTEVARFAEHVGGGELQLRRTRLRDVLLTQQEVLKVIADVVGVEPTEDVEALITRIKEVDRSVVVLEQAHRTFSRAVGRFEAIQTLLYVMNATSDQHFWLVTVHGPAWNFLAAVPLIVDVGLFRSVVKLSAFTAPMLRELCEVRTKACEQGLDYAGLMRNNLLGADPKVELERAINTFYRLLAESSEGNPRVALRLFAQSLESVDAHRCRVHQTRALSAEVASDLGIDAMFTLVAIRQQDIMDLSEIREVTNLPMHTIRNLIRDLQSRGLIEELQEQFYIPITKLPIVTRTLRRRHLMHLGT